MIVTLLILVALLIVGFMGPLYWPRCPQCKQDATRVIHCGLPMWFCFNMEHKDEEGTPMAVGLGFLSILCGTLLPWDGTFFVGNGPYIPALFHWWRASGAHRDDYPDLDL